MEVLADRKSKILRQWSNASSVQHSYKILLIGQTGSGKTSFVNLVCNYALMKQLGLTFDDENALKQLHTFAENLVAKGPSPAKLYNTELFDLKIGIIDTPGLADTRGLEQDKRNIASIIETIKEEDHINCICFVINGTESREIVSLKYVFTALTTILPKTVINNLAVVFTNTEDEWNLNFDTGLFKKHLETTIPEAKRFLINNPYCLLQRAKETAAKKGTKLPTKKIGMLFQKSLEVLKDMYEEIKDNYPVYTRDFLALYEIKENIEKTFLMLTTEYQNQISWTRELDKARKAAKAALDQKRLYEDFKTVQEFENVIVVKTKRHNTLCGFPQCCSNCHVPCHLQKSFDKETFKDCAAMNNTEYCTECQHHYTSHYHAEAQFEVEKVRKDLIDEKMKAEFDKAKDMEQRYNTLQKQCNKHIRESEAKREKIGKELLSTLDQFNKMSMNRNYRKVLEGQIDLIQLHIEAAGDSCLENPKVLKKVKEELQTKLQEVQMLNDLKRSS